MVFSMEVLSGPLISVKMTPRTELSLYQPLMSVSLVENESADTIF